MPENGAHAGLPRFPAATRIEAQRPRFALPDDTIWRIRKPDPQLLEFLLRYDPGVRELLLAVRRIVLREIPSVSETVNDVFYAVTVGFTFSGRVKEVFCYVVAYSTYVNLGFARGAELPDLHRRLKGAGKSHRHLRIQTQADLDDPEVLRFIRLAADRAEISAGPVALKPTVVVKESAARKRRGQI
jgi:hypothetical protein